MARRSVGRTLVRTPKRATFWEGATGEAVMTTGTVATVPVVTEATLENTPNPTLIRIHGTVYAHVTARTAAGDSCILGLGIMAQSRVAIAAGVASMPAPITDIGSPWIWHRQIVLDSLVAPPNGTDIGGNVRIIVDNKSMRKFDLNQGLQIILQNFALTGTITLSATWAFRLLFKR